MEVDMVDDKASNDYTLADLGSNKDQIPYVDKESDIMESNWTETYKSFDDMGLKKNLLKGIYGYGFEYPSPIQQLAIVPMVKGRDIIAQAQAGSGKTATFAIGSLQLLDPELKEVQVIVLSPTRELSNQTERVYKCLGFDHLKVNSHSFIGGTHLKNDINALQEGIQVAVGTPGRILAMIDKKFLKLSSLKVLIFDEADEMLSRNFLEDMKKVVSFIPTDTKIWLISATMPKEVVSLSTSFLNNPVKILVKKELLPLKQVNQFYVVLKKEWKIETLIALYKGLSISQAIIFCNSRKMVEYVSNEMKTRGHLVSSIHSELSQPDRTKIMNEFINGATRVMVTTDLLAKGIDIYQIDIVINYDFPTSKEFYLHRVGRCGRYNRKGNAINFVCPDEKEELEDVQKFYNVTIEPLPSDLSEI
jgi:translation initiation factor 4A